MLEGTGLECSGRRPQDLASGKGRVSSFRARACRLKVAVLPGLHVSGHKRVTHTPKDPWKPLMAPRFIFP